MSGARTDQTADTLTTDLRFAMIPLWVLDLPLSDRAVRLYAVLAAKADYGTGENAFPSRAWLAERVGCSVDSIDRAMRELTDAGAIAKKERRWPNGEQRSNAFTVRRVPVGGGRSGAAQGPQGCGGGGRTGAAHTESPVDLEPVDLEDQHRAADASLRLLPPSDPDEGFEDFWDRYPRGRAGKPGGDGPKKPARQRWRRMTGPQRQAALRAVDHYRAHCESPGGSFAAHATTWLNQDRWEQWQEPATNGHRAPPVHAVSEFTTSGAVRP